MSSMFGFMEFMGMEAFVFVMAFNVIVSIGDGATNEIIRETGYS